jgi:hypothetical protein
MKIKSRISPVISFHPQTEYILQEKFFNPILTKFFQFRKHKNYVQIKSHDVIHPVEFDTVEIDYLYSVMLKHVGGFGSKKTITYAVIHDAHYMTEVCPATGIKFSEIRLGKIPVFYYLYFDLHDIIDFITT